MLSQVSRVARGGFALVTLADGNGPEDLAPDLGHFFDTHIRDACLNLCVRVITVGGNGNADQACWPCPKGALEIGGEVDPLACLSGAGGSQNQASAELI